MGLDIHTKGVISFLFLIFCLTTSANNIESTSVLLQFLEFVTGFLMTALYMFMNQMMDIRMI